MKSLSNIYGGGVIPSSNISFNNSGLDLLSTNIQDAVTEVNTKINTTAGTLATAVSDISAINTKLNDFLVVDYKYVPGVSTNPGYVHDYEISMPKTGYRLLGCVGTVINAGTTSALVYAYNIGNNTIKVRVLNTSTTTAAAPSEVGAIGLFIKNS